MTDLPQRFIDTLEIARHQARGGDRDGAASMVDALVAERPDDAVLLHHCGIAWRDIGDSRAAEASFHRALSLRPDFHYALIELGCTHASLGHVEEALCWFGRALEREPGAAAAWLFAARLERKRGQGFRALDLLGRGLAGAGRQAGAVVAEILAERAAILTAHGQREPAMADLERVIALGHATDDTHADYLDLLNETGRHDRIVGHVGPAGAGRAAYAQAHAMLAQGYDRIAVLRDALARQASARWHDTGDVLARIRAAIASGRPLALMRVGDGEARFLAAMDPVVRGRIGDRRADIIGDSIWSNWFGAAMTDVPRTDRDLLVDAVRRAMGEADILGVPTAERLAVDHHHFGFLAYLDEQVTALGAGRDDAARADAAVNLALHDASAFYADLLDGLDWLGVIGPHPALAGRLGDMFGIRRVQSIAIPGEARLPAGARGSAGAPHFPDRFAEILETVRVPHDGAVVLVAGGLLGKVYCHQVRARGGIALDIGSLADAWMGYETRPGQFDASPRWRLPSLSVAA